MGGEKVCNLSVVQPNRLMSYTLMYRQFYGSSRDQCVVKKTYLYSSKLLNFVIFLFLAIFFLSMKATIVPSISQLVDTIKRGRGRGTNVFTHQATFCGVRRSTTMLAPGSLGDPGGVE